MDYLQVQQLNLPTQADKQHEHKIVVTRHRHKTFNIVNHNIHNHLNNPITFSYTTDSMIIITIVKIFDIIINIVKIFDTIINIVKIFDIIINIVKIFDIIIEMIKIFEIRLKQN